MSLRRFLVGVLLGGAASLMLASASSATAQEKRTWTDRQGRTLDRAEFVRIHQGVVILKRFDRLHKVPFSQLSDEDQAWLRRELKAQGKSALIPKDGGKTKDRPGRPRDPTAVPPPGGAPAVAPGGAPPVGGVPPIAPSEPVPEAAPVAPPEAGPSGGGLAFPPTNPGFGPEGSAAPPGAAGDRIDDPRASSPPDSSAPSMRNPSVPATKTVKEFRCSACKQIVSASSQAGQQCPHCGVYWEFDEEEDRIGQQASRAPPGWVWGGVMGGLLALCLVIAIRAFAQR